MAACSASLSTVLPREMQSQLLRDMQHWDARSILRQHLMAPESDTRATVGILNGTVFWLRPHRSARNRMLNAIVQDLVSLTATHAVPDVVLNLNAFDEPISPLRSQPTPVFSFFQTRAAADILVPDAYFRTLGFDQLPNPRHYRDRYPWKAKHDCALWRGSLF